METPPRDKKAGAMHPKQLHARLTMQMDSEMDVEGGGGGGANPEMERMGDEAPVHSAAVKRLDDDFDDQDLD
ncbi:hypothetical protein Gpo141_00005755 [Globisporangium polare]